MFKEKLKDIKDLAFRGDEVNNKKKIENLVIFIILLITTIIAINMIWKDDSKKSVSHTSYTTLADSENTIENSNKNNINEYNLEKDLEDILSKINGAGKVKVLITYSETSQIVPISNEKIKETITDEGDKIGGTRKIQESDKTIEVIYKEDSGKKEIITQKVIMPKIEGALILSSGANNANVRTNIIQAVEALTGLASHKIQVLQMEKE